MKNTIFKSKGILSILLSLIMIASISISANAQTSEVITYEEYSEALIQEYSKYGIEVEMKEIPGSVYTTVALQAELLKVQTKVEHLKASTQFETMITDSTSVAESPVAEPRAMYAYITASGTKTQWDLTDIIFPKTFTVKVTAELYVDVQRNNILSAGKPSLELMSATGYDDYISYISHTVSIDNSSTNINKHSVTYTVQAYVKESLSMGGVESWAKVQKSIVVTIKPFQ